MAKSWAQLKWLSMYEDILNYSHHALHYFLQTYLFYNWKCVPFDFLLSFCPQSSSPLEIISLFSVSMSLALFVFYIPHINEITYDTCLPLPSELSMLFQMTRFYSFYSWIISHCMSVSCLLYPVIYWWILRTTGKGLCLQYVGLGKLDTHTKKNWIHIQKKVMLYIKINSNGVKTWM